MKSQERPPDGWKLGRDSELLLVAWFIDTRKIHYFFSRDWANGGRFRNDKKGEESLKNLINKIAHRTVYLLLSENNSKKPSERHVLENFKEGLPTTAKLNESEINKLFPEWKYAWK